MKFHYNFAQARTLCKKREWKHGLQVKEFHLFNKFVIIIQKIYPTAHNPVVFDDTDDNDEVYDDADDDDEVYDDDDDNDEVSDDGDDDYEFHDDDDDNRGSCV